MLIPNTKYIITLTLSIEYNAFLNGSEHVHLLQDILYVESLKDYIIIHTASGKLIVKHSLSAFEDMLPSGDFLRNHRSYIIAVKRITGFTSSTVELPGITLPIGPNYKQEVFRTLQYDMGKE